MDNEELKAARLALGLTLVEASEVLETDVSTINRMERDPSLKTARAAPARVAQLYRAYRLGFRPANWPTRLHDRETLKEDMEKVRVDD